eukprot:gene9272-12168_t
MPRVNYFYTNGGLAGLEGSSRCHVGGSGATDDYNADVEGALKRKDWASIKDNLTGKHGLSTLKGSDKGGIFGAIVAGKPDPGNRKKGK